MRRAHAAHVSRKKAFDVARCLPPSDSRLAESVVDLGRGRQRIGGQGTDRGPSSRQRLPGMRNETDNVAPCILENLASSIGANPLIVSVAIASAVQSPEVSNNPWIRMRVFFNTQDPEHQRLVHLKSEALPVALVRVAHASAMGNTGQGRAGALRMG